MKNEELGLIRQLVGFANNYGYDYDLRVEVVEETTNHVKIRTINDEDETDVTALVRVLGSFKYLDDGKERERTLLGVKYDDPTTASPPERVVEASGISLFGALYLV
ncbi:MAG: hypothetical protein JRD89_01925 [Deltaproteobacteria bacterium]|nr:hypothetical protein [Deltaproteobacteria bacterium]